MRHALAIAILLCAPGLPALAQDPAYVDDPANRAVPDPARADGGGDRPPATPVAFDGDASNPGEFADDEAAAREALMATQRMAAAHAEAAYRGHLEGMAAARGDDDGADADPPVGGRSLLDDVRRGSGMGYAYDPYASRPAAAPPPETGPRQQIGAGLMQDAAGILDAKVRREIYGEGGPVYLPGDGPAY